MKLEAGQLRENIIIKIVADLLKMAFRYERDMNLTNKEAVSLVLEAAHELDERTKEKEPKQES